MFPFDTTYTRLPPRFYAHAQPSGAPAPNLVLLNRELAELLGLDPNVLASPAGVAVLAGNAVPAAVEPVALAYAGHQFGGFVPQLGDGRALLLGELIGRDGLRRDVVLKGAGRTPFSRGGDGRAALGPVLREYLVSEAMAALGVPTTRALAAVTTGAPVMREHALPGAVLTRIAASHMRIGTFELLADRGDREGLSLLVDYALARHYPQDAAARGPEAARALLEGVSQRQAALMAKWLGFGFVHGVMNTDNMAISGETLDYGPCAFLDAYEPTRKFSSIDRAGRYAFMNQPRIALWNLTRLAETLLPLLADGEERSVAIATESLNAFMPRFDANYAEVFRKKFGLVDARDGDSALCADALERLAQNHVDFTVFFRTLEVAQDSAGDERVAALFEDPGAFHEWAPRWRQRLSAERVSPAVRTTAMHAHNPAFIPRNHRVEEALAAAVAENDFGPFHLLHQALAKPFQDQPERATLAEPPRPGLTPYVTFCGT